MTVVLATFVSVFGRAIQQLNVVGGHYVAAALTPFLIAAGDVSLVLLVVDRGWWSIPFSGLGGAIGAVSAMWLHGAVKRASAQRKFKGARPADEEPARAITQQAEQEPIA